jgi:hypothetical protein
MKVELAWQEKIKIISDIGNYNTLVHDINITPLSVIKTYLLEGLHKLLIAMIWFQNNGEQYNTVFDSLDICS